MPIRVIGMIGVAPPGGEATVHVIKGGISTAYLQAFAQAHDAASFDLALVGYTASSAEGSSSPSMPLNALNGWVS
jgi:alkanesulfonate monooxygenase